MPNREMVNSYYVMDFYIDIKKNGDLKMITVWTAVKSMVAKVTQESEAQQWLVQCFQCLFGLFDSSKASLGNSEPRLNVRRINND